MCAGPPSAPPAPKICTMTQTYKSGSPAVPGGGEGRWRCCWAHRENENYSQQCAQARPAHPRPQNLHSDPDLQIRRPCGVRGRGGAVGGAAGRTPERKFGKLRLRAWPEPRSQRPGLKLGRKAKKTRLSGHTSFGDQGCSEKCCGKN